MEQKKPIKLDQKQKTALYLLLGIALCFLYATYVPYLLDYYIVRPDMPFLSFMYDRGDIANPIYIYECRLAGLFLVFLYCLTSHMGVSVLTVSAPLFILTHASYLKYMNRKEMLRLGDLKLTEAAGMALQYFHFSWGRYLLVLAGGLLMFVAAGFGIEFLHPRAGGGTSPRRISKQGLAKFAARIAGAVAVAVIAIWYSKSFFAGQLSFEVVDRMNLMDPDDNRYVIYRFLQDDERGAIGMEDVEECYADLLAQCPARDVAGNAVEPDIIVVLNESWWNTDAVSRDKVTFSTDPMAPFKELQEKCVTGYLTSNVYGGGTVSSETEFLTGIDTKYFVGDSTVYDQTMGRKLPSVIDYLRAQGYHTTSIHPYLADFYGRTDVYTAMGFDRQIFVEDMKYKDTYNKYISDESVVKQIIDEYESNREAQGDGNQFIWAITMANHIRLLDYDSGHPEGYDYPISVDVKDNTLTEQSMDDLVSYVNGIYLAGEAFEQLLDYFEKQDRPVILIMFGDHCPSFKEDALRSMGLDAQDNSQEMLQKLYSVPVVFWSNCEGKLELDLSGDGIYYLSGAAFEYAGLPDSDMMRIRRLERGYFRANTRKLVLDPEGRRMDQCTEEQMHILNEIKTIEYDLLLGELKCKEIWDPKTGE